MADERVQRVARRFGGGGFAVEHVVEQVVELRDERVETERRVCVARPRPAVAREVVPQHAEARREQRRDDSGEDLHTRADAVRAHDDAARRGARVVEAPRRVLEDVVGHVAVAAAHEAAGRAIDAVERAERRDVRGRERVEADRAARAGRRARDRLGRSRRRRIGTGAGNEADRAGRGGARSGMLVIDRIQIHQTAALHVSRHCDESCRRWPGAGAQPGRRGPGAAVRDHAPGSIRLRTEEDGDRPCGRRRVRARPFASQAQVHLDRRLEARRRRRAASAPCTRAAASRAPVARLAARNRLDVALVAPSMSPFA